MQIRLTSILIIILFLSICLSCVSKNKNKRIAETTWQTAFDFDNDLKIDTISQSYSGGAHCCYTIVVKLSSLNTEVKVPFEIDGGYVVFDLSKPENFDIKDYTGDGIPEIYIRIANYNGIDHPIPKSWTEIYGIKTNKVLVDFKNQKLHVSDYQIK